MPDTCNPYDKINGRWISGTTLNTYRNKVDDFTLAQDKVDKHVRDIVDSLVDKRKDTYNIHHAIMNLSKPISKNNLCNLMDKCHHHLKRSSFVDFFTWYLSLRFESPVQIYVIPDGKNSGRYRVSISSPLLPLNNKSNYTKNSNIQIRKDYLKFIKSLSTTMYPNDLIQANDVLSVETMIAHLQYEEHEYRDPLLLYNEVDLTQNKWKMLYSLFQCLQIPNDEKILVENPKYLSDILKDLQQNWNRPLWSAYWKYNILLNISSFHPEWRKLTFAFFGKQMMGQSKQISLRQSAQNAISNMQNTRISKLYIAKHLDTNVVKYVERLSNTIRSVVARRLYHNTWLSNYTKVKAIDKLSKIKIHIGKKKSYIKDPQIKYDPFDAYSNSLKYSQWAFSEQLALLGKTRASDVWSRFEDENVHHVNAYYYPNRNEIILPAALLTPPFVILDNPIEYNLAYIGITIAHEIIHAFDDEGSKYDKDGKLCEWWTSDDKSMFVKMQQPIYDYYTNLVAKEHFEFDPKLSMGEIIADIGALLIIEEIIYTHYKDKSEIELKRIFQIFHKSYISSFKMKMNKKTEKELIESDEHLHGKYRALGSLAFSQFYHKFHDDCAILPPKSMKPIW